MKEKSLPQEVQEVWVPEDRIQSYADLLPKGLQLQPGSA